MRTICPEKASRQRFAPGLRARIFTDVIPFFAHAFATAQEMIEESFLPWCPARGRFPGRFREELLELANPAPQDEIHRTAHEKMNVVGHDDVSADGDIEAVDRSADESNKRVVDCSLGEPWTPVVGAEGHKINRRIVTLKDAIQLRRALRKSPHKRRTARLAISQQLSSRCSHVPVGRARADVATI